MSQSDFTEIIEAFSEKFPPAPSAKDSILHLPTKEIENMIREFYPEVVFPGDGLFHVLKGMGYRYGPIEENEHIVMYWFISARE